MSYDPGMEQEALEQERFEADMEMAQLEAIGRRNDALRKRGICPHSYRTGRNAWNHTIYPQVAALSIGDELCNDCGVVIPRDSPDNWSRHTR